METAGSIHFRILPAGRFLMGGIAEDKFVGAVELPQHTVELAAFAMSAHPVSFAQWHAVMGGDAIDPGNSPVTRIDFQQACDFAAKLSARLPTEAEWEYACRAGETAIFYDRSALTSDDANFLYDETGEAIGPAAPSPVGSYPANAFGLHDMLGNVCEWTADRWHPNYRDAPADGSAWTDGGKIGCRVIRGGAWDHMPRLLRSSWRDWAPESARWDNLGFRLARDISP